MLLTINTGVLYTRCFGFCLFSILIGFAPEALLAIGGGPGDRRTSNADGSDCGQGCGDVCGDGRRRGLRSLGCGGGRAGLPLRKCSRSPRDTTGMRYIFVSEVRCGSGMVFVFNRIRAARYPIFPPLNV